MNLSPVLRGAAAFVCALAFAILPFPLAAQRPHANAAKIQSAPGSYDISQDASLQGSIVRFIEKSPAPPIGAHVLLQTPSGNVDVHIGNARLLQNARMNLLAGSSLRVVGQMQTVGKSQVFFARLVQQGSQLVAVRSEHGLPLSPAAVRANRSAAKNVDASQRGGAR